LRVTLGLVSLLVLGMSAVPALGGSDISDDPDLLEFQLGSFDVRRAHSFAYEFEYRSAYKIFDFVKPMVGVLSTSQSAVYGYGGFAVDFYFGRHIVVTPSLAIGVYGRGNDAGLGAAFPQFRTALEIAYRFDDASRVGVEVHHISNAGTSGKNPGAETALLTYAYPLSRLEGALFAQ
jgi:lipid A 3-O-deacylase